MFIHTHMLLMLYESYGGLSHSQVFAKYSRWNAWENKCVYGKNVFLFELLQH